jgi:hypothetical protein
MAIPRTPFFTALPLLDVNRIPNRAPRVIMIVDLFYWHEDLLSVTRNFAQKTDGAIALRANRPSREDMHRCIASFNHRPRRFQSISDIQFQTGKPITMPTANVAKK